jgi:hypothetical protein
MTEPIRVGDSVLVFLDSSRAHSGQGWYEGRVVRIDPYSAHRSFYWVEFDAETASLLGFRQISVFNPKNIRKA